MGGKKGTAYSRLVGAILRIDWQVSNRPAIASSTSSWRCVTLMRVPAPRGSMNSQVSSAV